METVMELKTAIVRYGRQMAERGLVAGTWGNISVRDPNHNLVFITPSGCSYHELRPEDIVTVNGDGIVLSGQHPSSELPLHLAIYAARADVQAIVHTHSLYATACAVAGQAIPPCLEELVQVVGGGVKVALYALPGSSQLAQNAVAALDQCSAALLSNHGAVSCAASLKEAMLVAELVEKAAHIHFVAEQLGGARRLSDEDVQLMRRFYLEHYRKL